MNIFEESELEQLREAGRPLMQNNETVYLWDRDGKISLEEYKRRYELQ